MITFNIIRYCSICFFSLLMIALTYEHFSENSENNEKTNNNKEE